MGVEIHVSIFDPSVAAAKGKPAVVGFSFRGMTGVQRTAALRYLSLFTRKLEEHAQEHPAEEGSMTPFQKFGSGEIIQEPDDDRVEAQAHWSEKDQHELREELEEDEESYPR